MGPDDQATAGSMPALRKRLPLVVSGQMSLNSLKQSGLLTYPAITKSPRTIFSCLKLSSI